MLENRATNHNNLAANMQNALKRKIIQAVGNKVDIPIKTTKYLAMKNMVRLV